MDKRIKDLAGKYEAFCIGLRREFHRIPELPFVEFQTSERIEKELKRLGIPYRRCGGRTGWLATLGGKRAGRCILLRSDMDALPVTEAAECEFVSGNEGYMHACGHDAHMAMMLTVCRILKEMEGELNGTVKVLFQPAEEIAQGAKRCIEEGCLEGVDSAFSLHVWADPKIPSGIWSCEAGPRMSATGRFEITITGKGGHGSTPQHGIDAAVVLAAVVNNLQSIVSRETDPLETAVVTCGKLEAGTDWNIIASSAKIIGTSRTFSREIHAAFPAMIARIARETAEAYRAESECKFIDISDPVVNDPVLAELCAGSAAKIIGKDRIRPFAKTMGGEDFCFYLRQVPGVQAFLGINDPGEEVFANHHPEFHIDESVLVDGVAVTAQYAVDYLNA
ncbi:MAG: amidohydrolase [Lachnospiraceae bacterium]|nr:amidohydrolase [Lachnospiraceae bacterium]